MLVGTGDATHSSTPSVYVRTLSVPGRHVCTAIHAPAPTVSRFGLLLAVATLIAIAAAALRRSLRRR